MNIQTTTASSQRFVRIAGSVFFERAELCGDPDPDPDPDPVQIVPEQLSVCAARAGDPVRVSFARAEGCCDPDPDPDPDPVLLHSLVQ